MYVYMCIYKGKFIFFIFVVVVLKVLLSYAIKFVVVVVVIIIIVAAAAAATFAIHIEYFTILFLQHKYSKRYRNSGR